MDALTWNLLTASVGIALVHTALGPDHYLPFVMLARARKWSRARALAVTAVCGAGHVLSSALLGCVGLAAGIAVGALESVEAHRGSLAGWALLAMGSAYALWGLRHARRNRGGFGLHAHGDVVHLHSGGTGRHEHDAPDKVDKTFWALFLIFVLGPCEPLIPLMIVPAAEGRWGLAVLTTVTFGVATIATMLLITGLALAGYSRLPLGPMQRWSHALAGSVIAICGGAVLFLDM